VRINRFEHLLKNLRNTQEIEISCSECFNLVSHFVEVEVSGEDASAKMPHLVQHLAQCPACQQDLQILENNDELPSMDDLQRLIS
jgi:Zn finger protein HypA/HybF involved in hydrogenase expression